MGVGIFVPIGALNRLQDRGSDKKGRLVEQREPEPPIIQSYNLWQASDVWLLVSFGFLRSSPTNSSPVLTNKKSKVPFQTHQLSQTLDTLLSIRWRCQTLCLISLTPPAQRLFLCSLTLLEWASNLLQNMKNSSANKPLFGTSSALEAFRTLPLRGHGGGSVSLWRWGKGADWECFLKSLLT